MPPKKAAIVYNVDDDDNSFETSENAEIHAAHSSFNDKNVNSLKNFLSTNCKSCIREKNHPETNITDLMTIQKGVSCYSIPDQLMPSFFKYLEYCRRGKSVTAFLEKQDPVASGIVYDLDLYQPIESRQMNDNIIGSTVAAILKEITDVIEPLKPEHKIYVLVTQKKSVKYKEEYGCFKDGFHIIIPSIKVSRPVKKFILSRIEANDILSKTLNTIQIVHSIKDQNGNTIPYKYSNIMDSNAAHFIHAFTGSTPRWGSPAHELRCIYEFTPQIMSQQIFLNKMTEVEFIKTYQNREVNLCKEFSLNYCDSNCIVQKIRYDSRAEYNGHIAQIKVNNVDMVIDADPKIAEIRQLVSIFSNERAHLYMEWFAVLCALATISPACKSIADAFSQRSSKYDKSTFEAKWLEAITKKNKNSYREGSIYLWASLDNPIRYQEIQKNSIGKQLNDLVYSIRKGELGEYDIAYLLYNLLKHKYATDMPDDSNVLIWYEFISEVKFEDDDRLYKWYRYEEKETPESLFKYIAETFALMLEKMYIDITNYQNNNAIDDDKAKGSNKLCERLRGTFINCHKTLFINRVISSCEKCFIQRGISRRMDENKMVSGMRNGVLVLSSTGEAPEFISGYHSYYVNKYRSLDYVAFDPRNLITKDIILTLRRMFPNKESDTFEWILYTFASTLDSRFKPSMFIQFTGRGGDGKSTICELQCNALGKDTYAAKLALGLLNVKNKNPNASSEALMAIKGKNFGYFSETQKHEIVIESNLKELTGGEGLSGRANFKSQSTFRPSMIYALITNYELTMDFKDYALRRRCKMVRMKHKFADDNYRRKNPNEIDMFPARSEIQNDWPEDKEILSHYFSILIFYHFLLQRRYQNKLDRIPSPHVEFETQKYFERQNIFNQFLKERLIITPKDSDETEERTYPLQPMIVIYARWVALQKGCREPSYQDALKEFTSSETLSKHIIVAGQREPMIRGHKILDDGKYPDETKEEKYCYDTLCVYEEPDDNFGVPIETPEEFYDRLCATYDEMLPIFNPSLAKQLNIATLPTLNVNTDEYQFDIETTKKEIKPIAVRQERCSRITREQLDKIAAWDSEDENYIPIAHAYESD